MYSQKTNRTELRLRIDGLIKAISAGMYEREEVISVSLLGALCGQNTFLYGPPGTAKSLISRRISCAFHKPAYFEYLMNRFSTPEEVFGPVSIKALKEDRYTRKTESYLPRADFAFLDEIWKSSPAILNTLLTLINEGTFKNGETIEKAPLKALIAASNEIPDINQGLEALYDRFIVRLMVPPIGQQQNFERLLQGKPGSAEVDVAEDLRIKPEEWNSWRNELQAVTLSSETLTIIHLVRDKLAQLDESLDIYVSDRRWQRAAMLMRAAAFFNGRSTTNHSDALLLQHCLWTNEESRPVVINIVADAVEESGIDSGVSLAEVDKKKESLDREIYRELFHSDDVYKTEDIRGKVCFRVNNKYGDHYSHNKGDHFFIPVDKMKTIPEFHPIDHSGNEITEVLCQFDGHGSCAIKDCHARHLLVYKPEILFKKGDKKSGINERLVAALSESVSEIKAVLDLMLKNSNEQFYKIEKELISIFVPLEKTNLAASGISKHIDNLKLRIKDCERLEDLCQ